MSKEVWEDTNLEDAIDDANRKRCKTQIQTTCNNLESNALNPLMLDLILEKLFPYCWDASDSDSLDRVKGFRLVCKTWDNEVRKIVRHNTEVDFAHIILPYPDGLGWAGSDNSAHYEAPYCVAPFENLKLQATCEIVSNLAVISWFQEMGPSVKRLCFNSSLVCYHQVRFLECVLKTWCKNLDNLHLIGVTCYSTLNHFSRFCDTPGFTCNIREILVDGELNGVHSEDCEEHLQDTYLSYLKTENEGSGEQSSHRTKIARTGTDDFPEFALISSFDEEGRISFKLQTDGGILGKIFKENEVEKVTIKGLLLEHTDAFIMSMNRRPNKISHTLKHFAYKDFPMFMWGWQMDRFRKLQFPLTKLSIGSVSTQLTGNDINSLLLSFSYTLEHVDLAGTIVLNSWEDEEDEEFIEITVPLLPKVKTFKNGNIFCLRLGGLDFVKNLPSLEKCVLVNTIYHSSIFPLNPSQVFNMLFQAASFENATHSLKDFRLLDGKISYTRHVQLLKDWFPHVKKYELTLDGSDVFVEFFRLMKETDVEDAKISFYSNDHDWCNIGIKLNLPFMNNLKFLDLAHLSDNPIAFGVKTFEDGFALAPKLTSLKLRNVALYIDEVERIRLSLSHISCVKFSQCTRQYKPVDAEFSVGYAKPFE